MNYDPTAQRFFYDARAQDCGVLRLPIKLINSCLAKHEYAKVRFELCTPFERLARVAVNVEPTELDVGVRLNPVVKRGFANHDQLLQNGVTTAINNIKGAFEPSGRTGMNLDDLAALAAEFCLKPPSTAFTYGGWLRNTQVWMNSERENERNTGSVDIVDDCPG